MHKTVLFVLLAVVGVMNVCHSFTSRAQAADTPSGEAGAWVIVSVGGEKKLAIYAQDAKSGELTPAGHIDLPGAPGSLALNATGTRLYAALRTGGDVATLAVDRARGTLKLLGTTKVEGNPVYVAVDPSGRYLLTSYYSDGKAAVYRLAADGMVEPMATAVVATQKNPHCILPHPQQPFVYVPNTGADVVLQYRLDGQTGALQPAEKHEVPNVAGSGPRHAFFHPSQPWLYVVNEKDSSVTLFEVQKKNGALTQRQKLSTLPEGFSGGNTCADIEVTPDGKYLYASNRGHDSLAMFAIDAKSGHLTSLGQVATEKTPREFAIDPSGKFVYSAGQGSGRLAAYRLDASTGKLQQFATYEVGASPAWVLVLPRE